MTFSPWSVPEGAHGAVLRLPEGSIAVRSQYVAHGPHCVRCRSIWGMGREFQHAFPPKEIDKAMMFVVAPGAAVVDGELVHYLVHASDFEWDFSDESMPR